MKSFLRVLFVLFGAAAGFMLTASNPVGNRTEPMEPEATAVTIPESITVPPPPSTEVPTIEIITNTEAETEPAEPSNPQTTETQDEPGNTADASTNETDSDSDQGRGTAMVEINTTNTTEPANPVEETMATEMTPDNTGMEATDEPLAATTE